MYSHASCSICLGQADFTCSGNCRRCFCKTCFTSPEVQSILQIASTPAQQSADSSTPATFLCLYCSRGQNICYYCFRPTSQKDFVCTYNNCGISAHCTCLLSLYKQNVMPAQCLLHTCAICNAGSPYPFSRSRGRKSNESLMLTCARCLKTAHLKCNNSHPIFQMIHFSSSFTEHGPLYSVLCRQCRMQIDSSFNMLTDSCSFLEKYKSFRLNELCIYMRSNPDAPSLSRKKVDAILGACEPYPAEMFWNKYTALLGVPLTPVSVTFNKTEPQIVCCSNEQDNNALIINNIVS